MTHIHTLPGQHDLTASALIFRTDQSPPRVLLHMHKKLQQWMQMGGHVELHETPWAAVIREIREESGYEPDQLRLLQPAHTITDLEDVSVAHPVPFVFGTHPYGDEDHYHIDTLFVMVADAEPRHKVAADESETLHLFTRQEVIDLPKGEIAPNIRKTILEIFDHLLGKWQEVDPQQFTTASRAPRR
jgi:8-oxo-dGTP pyrophosphatase MutT (NUDIX family)